MSICLPGVKMSLQGDSLLEGGLLGFMGTNSPTSVRHGDDLEYIRIWTTPHGAPSPYMSKIIEDQLW